MRAGQAGAQPFAVSVETSDLDEARELCGEHLYPRSIRLLDRSARISGRFAFLHMGGLTLADVRYGAAIAGDCGELGSYHVNLPVAGRFVAVQGSRPITGDPGLAGVYRPVGKNVLLHCSADCHLLALKVNTAVLEDHLAALLDAPVRGRLRLAGHMDVRENPGRGHARLMRLIADEIDNPTGLIYQPIVAGRLEEAVLLSLLHAVDHQYRDLLHRPGPRCAYRRVARVVDAIQADPQQPYTMSGLARIANVSVPSLRREFLRQVGVPPMTYLRDVRLAGAHAELRAADPGARSAVHIARRWGFVHHRGFVRRYRTRYGTDPSRTRRRTYRDGG